MNKKNMKSNPLALRLNKLIEIKGISKSDMVRICNVTPQSVNSWFARGSISKDPAIKLSNALHVSVAWILGEGKIEELPIAESHEVKNFLTNSETKLLSIFNKLPSADKEKLIEDLEKKQKYYETLYKELSNLRSRS
ncbi:MAG: transcriptional regulator [Candidatus Phlomobacter fragariae]